MRINLEKEGYETQTITVNLNTEQSINRRYRLKRKRKSESDIDLYSEKISQNSPKDSKDIKSEKITQVISLNKNQSKNQSNFFGEAEDFLFEIKECRKISSDERECTLLITNKEEERGLVIYGNYGRLGQSMLIDSSGNEALASKVTFGKKSNRAYVAKNMLFNIPTKVTIVFKGLISNDISVLLLSARSDDIYKQFNVKILPQSLNTRN
ncbi:MAG: hypothetical protein QNJ47_25790 [Nostocaceae cyanobacterium]|nr:hypothetical protein [Nostocaceae cyanobacterium]